MAHYAFLDANNVVTEVITGKHENENGIDWEQYYGEVRNQVCKRTSYNTYGGTHNNNGTPFRKNYAGRGYTYDAQRDAFIPPKPFNSWVLNDDTCLWEAPVAVPTDKDPWVYVWDEETTSWQVVTEQP